MGLASILEVIFVISVGGLFSIIVWPFIEIPRTGLPYDKEILFFLLFGMLLCPLLLFLYLYISSPETLNKEKMNNLNTIKIFQSYIFYLAFISSSGFLFSLFLHLSGMPFSNAIYGFFIYGFIYTIAYITPGAPGGIGVREALTILFFSVNGLEAEATMAAIIFRLVTILGELFCFLLTFIFSPNCSSPRKLTQF